MQSKMSFEANMKELEAIIEKLEAGESPLAEMVDLYEKGTRLGKQCMDMLEAYESKLEVLQKSTEGASTK